MPKTPKLLLCQRCCPRRRSALARSTRAASANTACTRPEATALTSHVQRGVILSGTASVDASIWVTPRSG